MTIFKILYFYLPAALANMAPILFKWIPFLTFPLDFNKKFRDKPILGKNKTFRGILCGILIAILVTILQYQFYPRLKEISYINYQSINPIILGFLFGFGTLFGDAVKSFFKRQFEIAPGKSWIPFDQLDWIISVNIFLYFYIPLPVYFIFLSIMIFGILHPCANLLGYYL